MLKRAIPDEAMQHTVLQVEDKSSTEQDHTTVTAATLWNALLV